MIVYFIVIFIIVVCALVYDLNGAVKDREKWINIVLILLILLAGFRYHIGTDSIYYENQFGTYPTIFSLKLKDFAQLDFAPFYVIFNSLLRTITSDFIIVQLVVSILINWSVVSFVKKHLGTEFIFTFLLFYFCTLYYSLNCETLRESIAISIFLRSIDYYKEKNWRNYYICVIIAFLFHYGAFLLFVLPLINYVKINKKNVVSYFVVFVGLILLIPYLNVAEFLKSLLGLFDPISQYSSYIVNEQTGHLVTFSAILNRLILPVFFLYYQTRNKNSEKWSSLSFMLMAYMITVWITTLTIDIFYRYNVYFGVIYYSFYAATVVDIARKYFRKSVICFIILLVPFSYGAYNNWTQVYVNETWSDLKRIDLINPYTSVFNKENVYDREKLYRDIGKY